MDYSYRWHLITVLLILAFVKVLRHHWSRAKAKRGAAVQPYLADLNNIQPRTVCKNECQRYRTLYFKLHHLEDHTSILQEARSTLLSLLSEGLQHELAQPTVLNAKWYSDRILDKFIQTQLDDVARKWQEYLTARDNGHPRRLFLSADEARQWLIRMAPLKLVDGAWLSRIHTAATPFAFRRITKNAWQILSEELGDGDQTRNHVYVYWKLLEKVGADIPAPESSEFIRHRAMYDCQVWKAAVSQLLISLFPDEFFPEILGFNLHFEMLSLETLMAAKELREVGLDPYYFNLHITIDNADSGHSAMASHITKAYIGLCRDHHGESAAQEVWRRIQAGYCLSKHMLPHDTAAAVARSPEKDIIQLFGAKSLASHGIHRHCPVAINGRPLSMWLDPTLFNRSRPVWQLDFLHCLSNSKPWVYKGDSGRSRLLRELSWGGSMFGAFTDREVALLRKWIDTMSAGEEDLYERFCSRTRDDTMLASQFSLTKGLSPTGNHELTAATDSTIKSVLEQMDVSPNMSLPLIQIDISNLDAERLLPVWLAHSCLLENMISTPWRAASSKGCAIVRLLRAHHGYLPEPIVVHGMDEVQRDNVVDLVEIGLDWLCSDNRPMSLSQALEQRPSVYAEQMLFMSKRPERYYWELFGMGKAFVKLHSAAASASEMSRENAKALELMVDRENSALQACLEMLQDRSEEHVAFLKGYRWAKIEIESCVPR